jgi:hypothetical protein
VWGWGHFSSLGVFPMIICGAGICWNAYSGISGLLTVCINDTDSCVEVSFIEVLRRDNVWLDKRELLFHFFLQLSKLIFQLMIIADNRSCGLCLLNAWESFIQVISPRI